MILTKNKEGVPAIRAIKYKIMWLENIGSRMRTFGTKYTNRIFESKDDTTSMKKVN